MADNLAVFYDLLDGVVGDVAGGLHFVVMPPDAVFPLVIYSLVWGGNDVSASGGKDTYLSRYQLDLYALTAAEVLALRRELLLAVRAFADSADVYTARVDLDVTYVVEELSAWRHILGVSVRTEWES